MKIKEKIRLFLALLLPLQICCGCVKESENKTKIVKIEDLSAGASSSCLMKSGIDIFDMDTLNDFHQKLDADDSTNMEKADWFNGGFFGCDFIKDNVRFADEHMELWLTEADVDSRHDCKYSGAEYRTQDTYGYGMYAVEMKPIKNKGVVSSFFTYTRNEDGSNWDEIDIEFLGKDTTKVQFNFYVDGVGKHEYLYDLGFDASDAFHEYGFLWLEDRIMWFVDHIPVCMFTSMQGNLPDTPGKIMMNVWNGDNSKSTTHWLGRYDGVTELHADYKSFVYTPVISHK